MSTCLLSYGGKEEADAAGAAAGAGQETESALERAGLERVDGFTYHMDRTLRRERLRVGSFR